MDYTTFKELWDASKLPAYYARMDDLSKIGFSFEKTGYGEMDYYESEALSEWLGEERSIMDVTLDECANALPQIKKRADELRLQNTL